MTLTLTLMKTFLFARGARCDDIAMTLKDESLLTAYLDGALEPDERSLVESALLLDPELAERLRGLAAVHELVAGLPRPVLRAVMKRRGL